MKTLKNHQANVLDVKARAKEFGRQIKLSTLAGAMTLLIAQSSTSYASDIEIYTKPSESSASGVVVMMLDTSGSMDVSEAGSSACDYPEGSTDKKYSNTASYRETLSASAGGYTRRFCTADVKTYYYRQIPKKTCSWYDYGCTPVPVEKWYSCGENGSFKTSVCTTEIPKPEIPSNMLKDGSNYYYKQENDKKIYDRLSRLKDALYTLATMPVYDPTTEEGEKGIKKDVKIGIGLFPYIGTGIDINRRGYIRIPAKAWGDLNSPQRQAVINLIKSSDFKGGGGTPTSAAYAEAAAYLLGTTTGGGAYSGIDISKLQDATLVDIHNNYVSPLDKSASAAECSGQGIYFLTDGKPQTPQSTDTSNLMAKALKRTSYSFSSGLSGGENENAYLGSGYGYAKSDWQAIGSFSKSLNDPQVIKNALGVDEAKRSVLTAVVGFGSDFDGSYDEMNQDAKNAYNWGLGAEEAGIYGKGGFIAARESQEIVESLNAFIGKVGGSISSL
ncbi:hypothetical protein [Acinetobacter indicus]|uniref:hypothetical protein n=1 Tax=Acinetobacter indicus TaxID=756892 RepID=UPI000CEC48D9|nr:hypothetical protein [Acinetobacter indicus]